MGPLYKNSSSVSSSSATNTSLRVDPASLPRWNLERHFGYASPYDTAIDDEVTDLQRDCKKFRDTFRGHLEDMGSLADGLPQYEKLTQRMGKVESYLFLAWAVQQTDRKLTTRQSEIKAKINQLRSDYMVFFILEVSLLDESNLQILLSSSESLRHYKTWIQNVRVKRSYFLSEEVERALSVRGPWSSEDAVTEYLEQQLAAAKFTPSSEMAKETDKKTLNLEQTLNLLFSNDPVVRRATLKCLNDGLETSMINKFASLSLNMVAGSWHIEQKERNYKTLRSSRNLSNHVPDDVVDALLMAVYEHGVPLSKRYYKLKKSVLMATSALKEFTWADRNAPLSLGSESKLFSWEEARAIVGDGYRKFSPRMAELFEQMVEEERIDMPAVDGKRSGAFCHGVIPSVGPFQMNNYIGSKRDVATLAHESGHGCHDLLAYKQGYLQYHPPLTLAETASIFGEMIVFRDLLSKASSKEERLGMLMGKIDEVINSVVRQCSFDRFEELVHTARVSGTVGDETFDKLWMQATEEFYGKEGEIIDRYENMDKLWSYVSHFHAVPFYVYSYAFADLVVGSLYEVYQKNNEGFEEKLLQLLEAGGTKDFIEVLKPFGLNPSDPTFWKNALESHLGSLLDEAEAIVTELKFNTSRS